MHNSNLSIQSITVVGAGTMGHGIAQVAASSEFDVQLFDLDQSVLERATKQIAHNLRIGVDKGKHSEEHVQAALGRIQISSDLPAATKAADVVIEAVPEDMALKRDLFEELSQHAPVDALLVTNTSSLSITEIASVCTHPERFVGMHFFNPPYILRLLELIRAEQTSDATMARATQLAEQMNRELIVVNDSPGFATSRLGLVLGLEAIRMLQEGVASAEDIDKAMELGYRHPMGPLKLTDLVGLDVRLAIADYLYRELGGEQFRPPSLLRRMVRAGKLGKKSGEGFYSW